MANEIIVRRCRRCGREFSQRVKPRVGVVSIASDAYVLRSYCPRCTWMQARAARECDPRWVTVGGHGEIPEMKGAR